MRFSCFFREDYIIRNSRQNGTWGDEETNIHLDEYTARNPIISGDFFMLYIFASDDKFHISINGRPFCTYKYRIPLESIRTLEIRDHIQAIKQIDHRTAFPIPWPAIQASDFGKSFSNDIPILFSPGHLIVITAMCFDNKKGQFIIKFTESDTKREELHFSVRFDQKVVVRNTMNKNYEFGAEERSGGFPFIFHHQFMLAIAFTEHKFLFALDGNPFCTYAYRTQNALANLAGFKITCLNGLKMHVTQVDHVQMGDVTCKGFESYSEYGNEIA